LTSRKSTRPSPRRCFRRRRSTSPLASRCCSLSVTQMLSLDRLPF
jgi:hypothetical protein